MTLDLQKILEGKRAMRSRLAARPVGEKLGLLDALRERELILRGAAISPRSPGAALREASATYGAGGAGSSAPKAR